MPVDTIREFDDFRSFFLLILSNTGGDVKPGTKKCEELLLCLRFPGGDMPFLSFP